MRILLQSSGAHTNGVAALQWVILRPSAGAEKFNFNFLLKVCRSPLRIILLTPLYPSMPQ